MLRINENPLNEKVKQLEVEKRIERKHLKSFNGPKEIRTKGERG